MSKNILVTGVSRGLGLEIARAVLAAGWNVYGVSRASSAEFEALRAQADGRVHFHATDLAEAERAEREIFGELMPVGTPIDGFVNNAAVAYDDLLTNADLQKLEASFAVNVFTPIVLTKYAIRRMLVHRTAGSIVHVSSISVHTGYKGLSMYAATKGALEAFSKNAAREWGERHIRSNCVVAGFMETSMSAKLSDEQRSSIYRRNALKSATDPRSVAAAVVYLLGEGASSVTGQNLFVDAGTI